MDITFDTQVVDVSVALNALKHYRAGEYKLAIAALQEILDVEPKNWDARLMLGVSFYRTAQFITAQRAFRYIFDNCPVDAIKRKAMDGLQAANSKLQKNETPAEF